MSSEWFTNWSNGVSSCFALLQSIAGNSFFLVKHQQIGRYSDLYWLFDREWYYLMAAVMMKWYKCKVITVTNEGTGLTGFFSFQNTRPLIKVVAWIQSWNVRGTFAEVLYLSTILRHSTTSGYIYCTFYFFTPLD